MRIAMITETWRPGIDGVVTRLEHTVRELITRGHQVAVWAPSTDPSLAVRQHRTAGVVFPFVDRHRRWGVPDPGLAAAVRAWAPDVVHLVNPVMQGSAALLGLAGRVPVVSSLHTDLTAYATRYHLGFTRPALRAINRATYRRADVRLATSGFGAALLDRIGAGPVELWPAAVDPRFGQARAARGAAPAGDPSVLRLLAVGRLAPEKDWDALVPLLRTGRLDGRALCLDVVGDGPERRRLEQAFAGTRTHFRGVLRGDDLVAAYRDADVLLTASTTETVGLTLLEAVAAGLPVVAVDGPQVRATMAGHPRLGLVAADRRRHDRAWVDALRVALGRAALPDGAPPTWAEATGVLLDHYATAAEAFGRRTLGAEWRPPAQPLTRVPG
ncbi:glycosyltransferase involved in cell wall biosynthesis [Friedmanniella endophytica]|uniref:Glycosyltransferase involved in cell wall biosynthesis n=1 Tax=Microlunatus kandeliicorticis TaxID=1759536 RepID=A0A7W3IPN5_9ACTN|nr:glycosyltransferase [Microlunatus kandeliicorticis]MBA8792947.1 glycosyltransferase involved in cell wall biosynthesis [Microlunatus kandeliicorticis]